MLRHQRRDHHRVDVGFLEIDQCARPVEDAARRNYQRAGESEIAQRFRSLLVDVQVISGASFRCYPWIPGTCAFCAFLCHFLRLRARIVRVGIAPYRFRFQCVRQIQPAIGIDKSRINSFAGEIPDPRFRRDLHIGSHVYDQSVANENRAFLDRFAGRRDDAGVREGMNPWIVFPDALLRNGRDLGGTGNRETQRGCKPQTSRELHARNCRLAGRARETSSRFHEIPRILDRKSALVRIIYLFLMPTLMSSTMNPKMMFIALEGCVGAGKSTVATGLAAHRDSTLLLEQFEQNPFLSAFYEDPVKYATETEFMFLLLHYHQLKQIGKDGREVISDFHLGKDLLYARLNFEDPKTLYHFEGLFEFLNTPLPEPSLLIGLSAPTELIIDRIRKRDRRFELKVDGSYYGRINSLYEDFFDSYSGRKLIVPIADWDFVGNPDLYDDLSRMIDAELQS